MASFTITPRGPFHLDAAQDFAGGFAPGLGAHAPGAAGPVLLMVFPVEGWRSSAAVNLWQDADGLIHGDVAGSDELEQVKAQAARSLSLDHDGSGWSESGSATRSSARSRRSTSSCGPSASTRRTRPRRPS